MAAQALSADKLARLWEELAACHPDGLATQFSAEVLGYAPLGQLQHELKRLKFVYTDAEAQRRFANVVQGNHLEDPASQAAVAEQRRKEAKEKNKSLKQRVAREQQLHGQLMKELTGCTRQVDQRYEQTVQDIRDAESTCSGEHPGHVDVNLRADATAARLAEAAEQSWRGAEDARNFWMSKEEVANKRRRLEAELRQYEHQKRGHETRAGSFAREGAHETSIIDSIVKIQRAEAELGLPRLEIDHARGIALLGEPPREGEEDADADSEAMRTIQMEFAEDGTLLRAETHPALGLQCFDSKAIAKQDFGMLPTLAWKRLCDAATDEGPEDFGGRVRRLSASARAGA